MLENDLLPAYKLMANHSSGLVTVSTLARYLHLPPTEPIVAQLFELYDTVRWAVELFCLWDSVLYRLLLLLLWVLLFQGSLESGGF